MTENGKKFLEQASKDAALQAELQKAQGEALHALLKDKGLEDAASQAAAEATIKVAAAHGTTLTAEDLKAGELKELSENELKAVAGGSSCYCAVFGAGTGNLACGCVWGAGGGNSGPGYKGGCACVAGGYGTNG